MYRFSVTSVFFFVSLLGVLISLNAVPSVSYERFNLGSEYAWCAKVNHRVVSYGFPVVYMTSEWAPHPMHDGNCPIYLNFYLSALLSNAAVTLVAVALGFFFLRRMKIALRFLQELSEIDEALKVRRRLSPECSLKDVVTETSTSESGK